MPCSKTANKSNNADTANHSNYGNNANSNSDATDDQRTNNHSNKSLNNVAKSEPNRRDGPNHCCPYDYKYHSDHYHDYQL